MKLAEIDEIENELEFTFYDLNNKVDRLRYIANEKRLALNTGRMKDSITMAFEDIKKQLEKLRLEEIRK